MISDVPAVSAVPDASCLYKDASNTLQIRVDAAKAAIGYEKPRLGTTTLQGDEDAPLRMVGELVWASE